MSNTDELTRLAELHRNGDLTDEEFAAAKKKVFESTNEEKKTTPFSGERPRSISNSGPILSDYTRRSGRPMSLLESPSSVAPQVIVKAKEGCFLQTLNVGCMIIAGFIALVILLLILSDIFSHH